MQGTYGVACPIRLIGLSLLAPMQAEREVLKSLRREQKDVWSRLWSIEQVRILAYMQDARFVEEVCDAYYPLPLVGR